MERKHDVVVSVEAEPHSSVVEYMASEQDVAGSIPDSANILSEG